MKTMLVSTALGLALAAGGLAHAQDQGGESGSRPTVDEPATAESGEEAALRKKVTFLLSGYEYFPTREDLDRAGDAGKVAGVLRAIAADENARPSLRLRAVDALGFYDDAPSTQYLSELVATPTRSLPARQQRIATLLRHHAMTSLARAEKESAVDKLAPFLEADDLQLRLTAISALGKHGGKVGREHLTRRMRKEKNDIALRELRKFVR